MAPRLTLREAGRLLVIVLIGAYMLAPVIPQVIGERPPAWIRVWRMYSGLGADRCQATYVDVSGGGEVPIDRRKVLGLSDRLPRRTPLKSSKEIDTQGAQLCARLRATDVRADARCGSTRSWRPTHARERNLCAPRK